MREYIVYCNGSRVDSNGFFCSSPCVTAYTKQRAIKLLNKALKYYYPKLEDRMQARAKSRIKLN
jgi:hypothetical protein